VTAKVAFMVMPFGSKTVERKDGAGRVEVDFDALWARVHRPVLEERGYRPIRADSDLGALIIDQMIKRLVVADVVVADITMPNANVYYEIGLRHSARERGCVLVRADWAKVLFDLDQIRTVQFPLVDGSCPLSAVGPAIAALRAGLRGMADQRSPVFETVEGYTTRHRAGIEEFEQLVNTLSGFQKDVSTIKAAADRDQRRTLTLKLLGEYGQQKAVQETVAIQIVELLRDHVGPEATLSYIASLDEDIRNHTSVIEQQQIALSNSDNLVKAAATLELLIKRVGPTSDRCGILGGRYKKLMSLSTGAARRTYLSKAIAAYEQGMAEDLNDYYPSSNLPRLYRRRGNAGDEERAVAMVFVVDAACRRAIMRDPANMWPRLTLLGTAFDRGEPDQARTLAEDIEVLAPADFPLSTTIADLQASVELLPTGKQERMREALEYVRRLLAPPSAE
jgi:tetratricopeptide (TPR) repeat protein